MAFVDQALTSIDTLCGVINPLNAELNPFCYFLALLAHHFLHVSRIRVKGKSVTPSLPRNANGVKNKVTVETARVSHYVLCHITSRYFLCEYSSRFVHWT